MKTLKTTLLALLSVAFVGTAAAQKAGKKGKKPFAFNHTNSSSSRMSNYYTFSYSSGTYSNLTGTTSINQGQLWDDPTNQIPIGFNFTILNQPTSFLDFTNGEGGFLTDIAGTVVLAPFGLDLIDRGDISGTSVSPLSYKVDGSIGSRIFKLEWQNVGFSDEEDSLGTLNDYINFQIWLYEGTNDVEYHFGSSSIINAYNVDFWGPISGAPIGIGDDLGSDIYFLTGPTTSPTMITTLINPNVTGTPPNGIIYKFTHSPNGIVDNNKNNYSVSFFPNPFNASATINFGGNKLNSAKLKITDLLGKTVKVIDNIDTNTVSIEKEAMSNGVYFYQLIENNAVLTTGKFVVN